MTNLPSDFQRSYLEHRDFIRTVIYWMVRSDETSDLVQETFVRAWKHRQKFKGDSSFRTWLYRIAINVTHDHLKKKPRYLSAEVETLPASAPKPELVDLIQKGVLAIEPKFREPFVLFYKLEYQISEIAELMDIPEGTVKSRLHTARDTFTAYLRANGVEHE